MSFESIAVVAGAARSGTSWLGQILDSSPQVAYRFQPFFSYAFKQFVDFDSPLDRWMEFFNALYRSDDEFLHQADKRRSGLYPVFQKDPAPRVLALKMNRYQYLLGPMLNVFPNLRLVPIVRHPAAVISSWTKNPKEFPPGSDVRKEWRFGSCKNQGREEEFFGYYKWKELAHMYLDLGDQFPARVKIVRYEALLDTLQDHVADLFGFLGLRVGPATREFLVACHERHDDSPYSVFRSKTVRDQWRTELPTFIAEAIERDLAGTRLEIFIR